MRVLPTVLLTLWIFGLLACTSSEQERAKEEGRQDVRKAGEDARKAGAEIKAEAKALSRRVNEAVQPDSESASQKMSNAETNAKDAASRVGINLDHAALITKIKSKLASEAGLDTLNSVDVSVEGSVVTLSGTVSTESQKQSAELAAAHVDGVTRVRNRLNVQP